VKISQKMGRKLYFKYLIQNLNVLFLAKIMWLRGFIIK
jgi:hypothetical protein